jgi:hypothetical protein
MRRLLQHAALIALAFGITAAARSQERLLVLENVRIIDGRGGPPIERGTIIVRGERIQDAGPVDAVPIPADAERIDLAGQTVIPGLIDLHFHIEDDPKLALRQLGHGVTSFRDPGQWDDKFVELRRMIAADGLPGPRIQRTRSSRAIRRRRVVRPRSTCRTARRR